MSISMLSSELSLIQRVRFLRILFLSFFLVLFGVGCSHVNDGMIRGRRAVYAVLKMTENILDEKPALADSLMRMIDSKSIRGKENRARYALLFTAAEFKNYQLAKSDSLIMSAVRYYSINNNIDYRFLSYYYLGCVYLDLNRMSDAGAAFTNAEQLSDQIDNDFWKGLLFYRLGFIFTEACDYHRAEEYYSKSEFYYKQSGSELHRLYAKLNVGQSKKNMQEYRKADSLFRIVEKESVTVGNNELHNLCLNSRLSCLLYMQEPDSATQLLNKNGMIDESSDDLIHLELMAMYYNIVKDYAKSESCLERAWLCDLSERDSVFLYYTSSLLAKNKGQTEEALQYYREYTDLQNRNLRAILNQPILAAQKEQYKMIAENELLKYRHARLTLMLSVLIFLLILVIVLVTYHYKKKRMKEQLYDSLAVVEELSGRIEDLKNQVRVQFHERHDISNRLYSMYFDSTTQDKVTKQQLNVTINSLIKDYTSQESVRKLDKLLNDSYDGIMNQLANPEFGLTDKELELFRYSFAGLSSKAVSIIIKESPQNIYQIKSRLLKKVRRCSEELWSKLNDIW